MQTNSDNESSDGHRWYFAPITPTNPMVGDVWVNTCGTGNLTAEKIRELWVSIKANSISVRGWFEMLSRRYHKRRYLRNSKRRIQVLYWAKGHKHRMTRRELTARGQDRRVH